MDTDRKSILKKFFRNHLLVMALCCLVPMTLFIVLAFTGLLGSWGLVALFLLCPLMHIVMMKGMIKGHGKIFDYDQGYDSSEGGGKFKYRGLKNTPSEPRGIGRGKLVSPPEGD